MIPSKKKIWNSDDFSANYQREKSIKEITNFEGNVKERQKVKVEYGEMSKRWKYARKEKKLSEIENRSEF